MARFLGLIFSLLVGLASAAEHGGGSLMYVGGSGIRYSDMQTAGASYRYGSTADIAKYNCVGSGNYCVNGCAQASVSTYRCNVRDPSGGTGTVTGNIVIKCADGTTGSPSSENTVLSVCGMSADEKCAGKPLLGSASTSWIGSSDSSLACIGGCAYVKSNGEGYWSTEHKVSVYKGVMAPLGSACAEGQSPVYTNDPTVTGTEPTSGVPSDTPKPDACKPGQVPAVGTVNGKSVPYCAGADKSVVTSTSQKDATSAASSPAGASSGSKSETETKSTTCSDGKCTTTTTKSGSTDGGAGAGGTSTSDTETKTESQADYCKENPAQPICKQDGDSFFGGSCGAFSCDGDAVQCAIAREQHQRNCQLFDDRTPLTEIGEGAAGAGNRPSDHPGNNPDDIDVGARMAGVARENPFGDGCPRDFDLVVMGNVVTVPLSNACDVLKLMGEIAVAFAFIAAARIVMSGVSSGAT